AVRRRQAVDPVLCQRLALGPGNGRPAGYGCAARVPRRGWFQCLAEGRRRSRGLCAQGLNTVRAVYGASDDQPADHVLSGMDGSWAGASKTVKYGILIRFIYSVYRLRRGTAHRLSQPTLLLVRRFPAAVAPAHDLNKI